MSRTRWPIVALGLLGSALSPGSSLASPSTHEPPSNFVGTRLAPLSNDQGAPVSCSDGEGGTIVVFEDWRSSRKLYAQRLSMTGTPLWGATGAPICPAAESPWAASVCEDGAGGAIIAWADARGGGGVHSDIYVQRIDPSGTVLWAEQGVLAGAEANSQYYPRMVSDGAGGVILTWWDNGPSNAVLRVHAQRVSRDGFPLWGPAGLTLSAIPGGNAVLASDGAGGAIIAWTQTSTLFGQHVTVDGQVNWGAGGKALAYGEGTESNLAIVADGSGGAFLAWHSYLLNEGHYDAFIQRLDAAGDALWAVDGVLLSTAPNNQATPQLALDDAGGVFAVWIDLRNGDADIYAQRFGKDGAPLWAADGLEVATFAGIQRDPQIQSDGTGGVIVAWQDERGEYDGDDIYIQGLDALGTPRWETDGLAFCTARNGQVGIDLSPSLDGAVTLAWADGRHAPYSNVYAARTPLEPVAVRDPEVGGLSLAPPGPNPSRGGVTLAYTLTEDGPVRLELFDVAGRRVRSLFEGVKSAGPHREHVDVVSGHAPRLASGLYVVRLEAEGQVRTRRLVLLP